MTAIDRTHPVQLVLGTVLVAEELATKGRQMTLGVLCADAMQWASDCRDLFREIARECDEGVALVEEVAADGVITAIETSRVRALFAEIGTEARTGRIIS